MNALILAGGFGTRLRPLTYRTPKCLLTINNKTILEHQLNLLEPFDEIIMATNYLEDQIKDYLNKNKIENVTINNEPQPLGTAGAILNAKELLDDEFMIMNGDIILDCNIEKILRNRSNSMLIHNVSDVSRYGSVFFNKDGKITHFKEKEIVHVSGWINAGLYYLNSCVFDYIPGNKFVSLERDIFPILVEDNGIKAIKNDGYWYDVGTKDDFINANLSISGNDCVIGHECSIIDSNISQSVIMDNCVIENCSVTNSIIGPKNVICNLNIENKIVS